MTEEYVEIVDGKDRVLGTASRSRCHGDPTLVHRTAHVIVLGTDGRILLQKRARNKDIQPGRWDTAVGGHLAVGETYEQAARREMNEEIGLSENTPLKHLFDSRIRNCIESENVRVFQAVSDGPFTAQPGEIDELRFWTWDALRNAIGRGLLTPNLEAEIQELERRGLAR